MKTDFFAIYDAIGSCVTSSEPLTGTFFGERWAMAEAAGRLGIAMATPGDSIDPLFPAGLCGHTLSDAAKAVSSWNLTEASLALAAANCFCNFCEHAQSLGALMDPGQHYTHGIDFRGKKVAMIGHLHGTEEMRRDADNIYIIEREPKTGDYPDAACDYILPQCDIVIITGSSIINKTLPHLLELCENALTVLTGPSVPLCPALLDLGIDRIAGLCLTDKTGITAHVKSGAPGSPYGYGRGFLLTKE